MKILFDNIIYSMQHSGGGSVYWTELIKRFLADQRYSCIFIEQKKQHNNILRRQLMLDNVLLEARWPLLITRFMPLRLRLAEPTIFHSSYYRVATCKSAVNVVTVHDFTHEKFLKGINGTLISRQKAYAIRRAAGIICISENTRRDLMELVPGLPTERIRVIMNGVSDEFVPAVVRGVDIFSAHRSLLGKRVILFVGHRTSYKNFALAAQAFAYLPGDYALAIVGEPLLAIETELLEKNAPGRYSHLGRISTRDLNLAYQQAACLLYPSSYEGFGIPPLEAMKAGCPVVAANTSSIPEVVGGGAILVKDVSAANLASAVRDLLNQPEQVAALKAAGFKQAQRFSWQKTYDQTRAFYKDLINEKINKKADNGA